MLATLVLLLVVSALLNLLTTILLIRHLPPATLALHTVADHLTAMSTTLAATLRDARTPPYGPSGPIK